MNNADQTKETASTCEECKNYEFVIAEMRKRYFAKTLGYIATLAFVAMLAVTFHSYIPCAFLLLALLFL